MQNPFPWNDPDSRMLEPEGGKAKVGPVDHEAEDAYEKWRRRVGHGCYALNVDACEWRGDGDNKIKCVGVIEITFPSKDAGRIKDIEAYSSAVMERFCDRDMQYQQTMQLSRAMKVEGYLVIAERELDKFSVCELSSKRWVYEMTEPEYKQWIIDLEAPDYERLSA